MDDATKAAVEWLRGWYCTAPTDAQPGTIAYRVRLLLAHLDGEPERLAAKAEEVREACARLVGEGVHVYPRGSQWADEERTRDRCVAAVRATPLDARPLADRIAELEAELSKSEWRVAELEDDVADARILLEPHFGQETYQLPLAKTTAGLIARAEKAEARVAELEAQAATDDAHAVELNDAHLRQMAVLRARIAELEAQVKQSLDPIVRAKMQEPPPPMVIPYPLDAIGIVRLRAEKAECLADQLCAVLGREAGNRGDSEGAVDVAERLIRERDEAVAALRRLMSVVDGGESGVAQVVDVSHSARAVLAKYPEGK